MSGETRYRCPKCGRIAVNVVHYPESSKAICLDGHEWDPFADRPASPPPAVTGDAMTEERLAEIRKRVNVLPAWELVELLTEVDRLRVSGTADERLREAAERFARWLRDGFDHETDAHRYDNGACRVCRAEEFLAEISRASLPSEREEWERLREAMQGLYDAAVEVNARRPADAPLEGALSDALDVLAVAQVKAGRALRASLPSEREGQR